MQGAIQMDHGTCSANRAVFGNAKHRIRTGVKGQTPWAGICFQLINIIQNQFGQKRNGIALVRPDRHAEIPRLIDKNALRRRGRRNGHENFILDDKEGFRERRLELWRDRAEPAVFCWHPYIGRC